MIGVCLMRSSPSQYCDWIWNNPWTVLLTKFIRSEWAKETPSAFSQSFTGSKAKQLQGRLQVPFDGTLTEHKVALRKLWRLAYPSKEIPPLKSELWKEMGWQGQDPSTDFRGGGYISLENLIYFAEEYPEAFQNLLHKQEGKRAEWEYPFAVAGVNISFMLAQMLDLQSGKPISAAAAQFLELLAKDEMAFDGLFCVAFRMMDPQSLAKHASYMEFNDVLKSTRAQLEWELELEDITSERFASIQPIKNLTNNCRSHVHRCS